MGTKITLFSRFRQEEEGATSVVFAISMVAIIGAFGFMTEVGYWRLKQTGLQTSADMASLAAANQYIINRDERSARVAAFADAVDNQFDPSDGRLTVNIPPSSGDFTDNDAIEVIITQELPTFFSGIFLSDPVSATVSAVTKLGGQSSVSCVLSLGSSGTTISVGGNVSVNLDGCGLHANSTGTNAINAFGSVDITAACLSATGGIDFSGQNLILDECAAPRENQPPISDPYSDVDVPANADTLPCNNATTSGKGKNKNLNFPNANGGVVRICNGSLNLTNTVNLQPGTYIIDGTDISFGNNGGLVGNDVTLIFRNNAELDSVNGNNAINLSAPSTGPYAGIVLYADRNTMAARTWRFQGNADVSLAGAAYLPTLNIDYGGGAGSNETQCTQIIANRVDFIGNSNLNSDCEGFGTREIKGGAFTTVQLVE